MIIIPQEKIIEVMQDVIDRYLKPKFIELGMNASGQWLESLEARSQLNSGEVWGQYYTEWLVRGRAGGTMPPVAKLVTWVEHKFGLHGKEAISAAWAVAKKIEREGTSYYPNGTDLLEVLESKEVNDYVNERIGEYIVNELTLSITRQAQQILA